MISSPPALLPIAPKAGLFLVRHGHGDEERFANLFRETWKSIPREERRALYRY
jgi:hypothetical protein